MYLFEKIFFEHPRDVSMTYKEHFKFSMELSQYFCCASIKACIHSFIPCMFITSSTDYLSMLSKKLDRNK